jgi:DNA-binding MarR family transcriptional regulator
MTAADSSPTIAESLSRLMLASERHLTAVGRLLRLPGNELLAVIHLRRAGTLTPTELGRLLSLTSGGTTALVQRLERDGHVVRERHPADGRSALLRLSGGTERRVAEEVAPLFETLDARLAELSAGDRATVLGFLGAVADVAERSAERATARAAERERPAIPRPVPSAAS